MKLIHFYIIFILKTIETEQQNNKICHSVSVKNHRLMFEETVLPSAQVYGFRSARSFTTLMLFDVVVPIG